MPDPEPEDWLISFADYPNSDNDGRPFGDGSHLASRAGVGDDPWDVKCKVETFIDGYDVMNAIREEFRIAYQDAIDHPNSYGERSHVYIAGWRLNPNRVIYHDMTTSETIWYWIEKLMEAGVRVRILLWVPAGLISEWQLKHHIHAHLLLARLVQSHNSEIIYQIGSLVGRDQDIGVVFLDTRCAENAYLICRGLADYASHHQKFIVIRGAERSVAFCGGVDLAYSRRNLPSFQGDSQSGDGIPPHGQNIERPPGPSFIDIQQGTDLPSAIYGSSNQIWHDQHLRLEGPIVATLENVFGFRWSDALERDPVFLDDDKPTIRSGTVISTSRKAVEESGPLPTASPISEIDIAPTSTIQRWLTIPLRFNARSPDSGSIFSRGEFTVMAGLSKACKAARNLILIFDQYFWDVSYARLLRDQLLLHTSLNLIIILPPHSDIDNNELASVQHYYRREALQILPFHTGRIGIFSMWNTLRDRGIYCHSKVQIFDDVLLVCGSANINQRSFALDSELSCAVLSRETVQAHYRKLWDYLFEESLPPSITFNPADNWSSVFLQKVRNKVNGLQGMLIEDPWQKDIDKLPKNGYRSRDNSPTEGLSLSSLAIWFDFMSPSSLPDKAYSAVHYPPDPRYFREVKLDDIVNRVERQNYKAWRFP